MTTFSPLPRSVEQALDDVALRPTDRLAMWMLYRHFLDAIEYRAVTSMALAHIMRIEDQTAGRALRTLVERGYLDEQRGRGRERFFRLPGTRRGEVKVLRAA